MNGLPSLNSFKDWLTWAFWLALGGGLAKAHSMYITGKRLPSEIHRTDTESERFLAEAGKARAEARKIETESDVTLLQTVHEMAKEIVAENKSLRTDLVVANKTIAQLEVERNTAEAELARANKKLAEANERLVMLESLGGVQGSH